MKGEPDESTLQPVVDRIRKRRADIRINLGLVVRPDQVEEAPRIVGEAAAIGKIAHIADARPACRCHILIGGTKRARVRKGGAGLNLDRKPGLYNGRRDWVYGDLALHRARGAPRQK